MTIQKTLLRLALMACLTATVSARTADTSEVSKQENAAEGATSSSGRLTSDSNKTVDRPATEPRAQAASSDEWKFQVAPYLFLVGASGDIGVNGLTTEVDASAGDILDTLNFGFMGAFEARKNRFSILTDLMYANLEKSKATSGPLFSGVTAEATMFLFSPQVGYALIDNDRASLDAMVGIRFWHTSHELEFSPRLLPAARQEGSKNWADVIAGLRGQVHLTERIFVMGRGDLGGGGSDFTYQLFGAAGFDVTRRLSLVIGYRHLDINYDRDGFLFDGALHGVMLGMMFRF